MGKIKIEIKNLNGWKKVIGLIGKRSPETIFFRTRFGIHTFGVKFPIDVLILNSDMQVELVKKNLKPSNIFLWNPKFDLVLELPSGYIKEKEIKKGDRIEIKFL